jgi:hypothetical protein
MRAKSVFLLCILFFYFFLYLSCASPGAGPRGILFTKSKIGIFATGEQSKLSSRACIHSILGLFAFGDASIPKIKSINGIIEVTDVNWETNNFLGIYSSLCVVVGGNP